ncbi:UNVERIFIED_ORG: hypothetical protein OKW15_003303 [Pseudomonas reinekei]|nr:hypothetical protein [Pseudomonas reinekei]
MFKEKSAETSIKKYIARFLFGGVCLYFSLSAAAAVNEITAVFKPDPANPLRNLFLNTTPNGHFCGSRPSFCKDRNLFSLRVNMPLEQTVGGKISAGHINERLGAYLKAPSEWRSVEVHPPSGGPSERVEVRIAGIGGRHDLGARATELAPGGHSALWSIPSWASAPAPCSGSGSVWEGPDHSIFMWIVPENTGSCSTQAKVDIPNFRYRYLEIMYELRTPNPLTMRTGTYVGTISYTLGPMMDFDLGDLVLPKDNTLQLNFTLDVQHSLKVEIPPGGNRVELVPQGGWQAWLNQGRKPVRLFRDQTFNVSSSIRFKMQLECQYTVGNTCALRDTDSTDLVPLNTSISLPNGLTDGSGQAVDRRPLRLDGSGTELFQPGFYVDRKPGTLHFEVTKEHVETILREGVGKTYSGNVTVIWDSELI